MACYHPLKAFDIGNKTEKGLPSYKITSYETTLYQADGNEYPWIEIPCGRCIGCRLAYSRMWADRCVAEATLHEESWFLTLTYDNEHLPYMIKDHETGEIHDLPSLDKRDCQLFMKRLRKNYKYDNKIRFYLAGEYGSIRFRPHYHVIAFGLKLDDIELWKKTDLGFPLYKSEFIDSVWQQGMTAVAEVTWETCAYTARYIMKKQTGEAAEVYKDNGIQSEFTLMSNKPGIGKEFLEKNKLDFLRHGEVNISTPKGGLKVKSTKYFDKWLDLEYPEERKEIKEKNTKIMQDKKKHKLAKTSNSYLEMLEVEENNKKAQLKRLPRKEV